MPYAIPRTELNPLINQQEGGQVVSRFADHQIRHNYHQSALYLMTPEGSYPGFELGWANTVGSFPVQGAIKNFPWVPDMYYGGAAPFDLQPPSTKPYPWQSDYPEKWG